MWESLVEHCLESLSWLSWFLGLDILLGKVHWQGCIHFIPSFCLQYLWFSCFFTLPCLGNKAYLDHNEGPFVWRSLRFPTQIALPKHSSIDLRTSIYIRLKMDLQSTLPCFSHTEPPILCGRLIDLLINHAHRTTYTTTPNPPIPPIPPPRRSIKVVIYWSSMQELLAHRLCGRSV